MVFVARTGEVVAATSSVGVSTRRLNAFAEARNPRTEPEDGSGGRRAAHLYEDRARLEMLVQESEALKSEPVVRSSRSRKGDSHMDHRVQSLTATSSVRAAIEAHHGGIAALRRNAAKSRNLWPKPSASLVEIAGRKGLRLKKRCNPAPARAKNWVSGGKLRRDFAGLQSQLAVLEERRSTVTRELAALRLQAADSRSAPLRPKRRSSKPTNSRSRPAPPSGLSTKRAAAWWPSVSSSIKRSPKQRPRSRISE